MTTRLKIKQKENHKSVKRENRWADIWGGNQAYKD